MRSPHPFREGFIEACAAYTGAIALILIVALVIASALSAR